MHQTNWTNLTPGLYVEEDSIGTNEIESVAHHLAKIVKGKKKIKRGRYHGWSVSLKPVKYKLDNKRLIRRTLCSRKSAYSHSAFSVTASQECNSVPRHIREISSYRSFSGQLKIWLIGKQLCVYCNCYSCWLRGNCHVLLACLLCAPVPSCAPVLCRAC